MRNRESQQLVILEPCVTATDVLSVLQVTVHYEQKDGAVIPKRVHTIVISVQHDDYISLEEQKQILKNKVKQQYPLKQTSSSSNSVRTKNISSDSD